MTLGTPVLAALAVTLSVSSGGECPKGADYLVTIPDVLGACAVAFDGKSILACAPEQVADGGERQVVRALAIPGRPDPEVKLLPSGAGAAGDIDVSADGTGALADAFSASCSQLLEDHTPGEDSYQLLSTCARGVCVSSSCPIRHALTHTD